MRSNSLSLAITLCLANAGCGTFWTNTARNLTEAPIYGIDQCHVSKRNYRLARDAWRAHAGDHLEHAASGDFRDGFIEGFADYLESGGNGQPPAVPPFRYRLSCYQTPEGYQAIEDWYAGFRAGAAAAMSSGLREQFVLPLSAPPIDAVGRNPAAPLAGPSQELPPPRPATIPEGGSAGPPG